MAKVEWLGDNSKETFLGGTGGLTPLKPRIASPSSRPPEEKGENKGEASMYLSKSHQASSEAAAKAISEQRRLSLQDFIEQHRRLRENNRKRDSAEFPQSPSGATTK